METMIATLVERHVLATELTALLRQHPLVAVHGPPGSGKSYFLFGLLVDPPLTPNRHAVLLSTTAIAPTDPLRRLGPDLHFEDLPAADAIARMLAVLGAPSLPLPHADIPDQTWTWVARPTMTEPPDLLLLDGFEALAGVVPWLGEMVLRYLNSADAPRLVATQRAAIDWHLHEINRIAGALPMIPFGDDEIAEFVEHVIQVPAPNLARLLMLVTAGFPLALVAWGNLMRRSLIEATPADGELFKDRTAQRGAQNLLIAGAALIGRFDRAALRSLLFDAQDDAGLAADLAAALQLTLPAGEPNDAEYVRAQRTMRRNDWLQPTDALTADEVLAPPFAAAVIAEVRRLPGLLSRVDASLARHYRKRLLADPFRAQGLLVPWLMAMAGREELCHDEYQQLEPLFAHVTICLAEILRDNPFADLGLLSDIYTNQALIALLRERNLFGEVDRLMQHLIQHIARVRATQPLSTTQLKVGQEIGDEVAPLNRLMRLPQQALLDVLGRLAITPQSWEVALGRDFAPAEPFARDWFEECAPTLYEPLRAGGVIVGRTVNHLAPMIQEMFRGEDTLVGRLLRFAAEPSAVRRSGSAALNGAMLRYGGPTRERRFAPSDRMPRPRRS